MGIRRLLTVGCATVAAVVAMATGAVAHQGVILDASDRLPWQAPLALDGTDEFAWFGKIPVKHDARSFQLKMLAGQQLHVRVVIPNKAPENTLATADLPRALVVAPNGTVTTLTPTIRTPIHTPDFGGLDLIVLRTHSATAQSGVYSVIVSSSAPGRFAIATGVESDEFHGMLRGRTATDQEVQDQWYNAP